MKTFTNIITNITYVAGITTICIGLIDKKMRLLNVDDTHWIILSFVLGIVFPVILNALFFKNFSLHFWNKFK